MALWRESEVLGTWIVKAFGVGLIVMLAAVPAWDKGPVLITTLGGMLLVLFMAALFYFS